MCFKFFTMLLMHTDCVDQCHLESHRVSLEERSAETLPGIWLFVQLRHPVEQRLLPCRGLKPIEKQEVEETPINEILLVLLTGHPLHGREVRDLSRQEFLASGQRITERMEVAACREAHRLPNRSHLHQQLLVRLARYGQVPEEALRVCLGQEQGDGQHPLMARDLVQQSRPPLSFRQAWQGLPPHRELVTEVEDDDVHVV